MAATGMLIPATVPLTAIIGANFSTTITLYTDVAQTVPFDLTGYTVSFQIGSLFTLTSGAGLTITAGSGLIVAALTAAQTATAPPTSPGGVRHSLKLTDGSGAVSYPLSGPLIFQAP